MERNQMKNIKMLAAIMLVMNGFSATAYSEDTVVNTYDEFKSALSAAGGSGTYSFGADITVDSALGTAINDVVLNGNNHSLTAGASLRPFL